MACATWLANTWARSSSPESWEAAAKLEPGNAEHWRRLGRFRQWDFENADLALAVQYYRRAVALNPASASYWMDLASAYEMQGDAAWAREAYERAKQDYPISSDVAWNYGNFLLRAGHNDAAFAEIHRALQQNAALVPLAVSVCWRAGAGLDRILHDVLPARSSSYLEAIDFFVAEQQLEPALRVWERLETVREPLELRRVLHFLEVLLQQDRVTEAMRVWRHALEASRWPDGRAGNSLVWDGGFEQDFLNGGFGWRRMDVAGARIELDADEAHSGARSLRMRFDGSANVDLAAPQQFVAVEPRTRYRFSAWLKLEGISTDSGVSFRILDPRNPQAVNVLTQNRTDTQPWTQQEAEFTTGRETRLLLITPRRAPSAKLDNKIGGTAWVDDVSLTPAGPAPERQP